ncbi:MAG: hypothetical protein V2A63_01340 [Patescibacteria group bacterium]
MNDRLSNKDSLSLPLREQARAITNAIRAGQLDDKQLAAELTQLGCEVKLSSPNPEIAPETDKDLKDFYNVLAGDNGRDENGKPNIQPSEIKSEETFLAELTEKPNNRVLMVLKDKTTGEVMNGIYGPLYMANGKLWATLEYQCSANTKYAKQGFGSLVFAIYEKKLKEIAEARGVEFGGILIEAVDAAAAYWGKVGAKGVYAKEGNQAKQASYAMPCVEFDPQTGQAASGFSRENIKIVPSLANQKTITVGEFKKIIEAFYHESYWPKRENFENDAAHQKAVASVQRTLDKICLRQFKNLADDFVLHLNFDEELVQEGLVKTKPWERNPVRNAVKQTLE